MRRWRFGLIAPFAGRIVSERLECDGIQSLRILADEAVQSLPFCSSDADGICTVAAFHDSQHFATNNGEGLWEQCGWQAAMYEGEVHHDPLIEGNPYDGATQADAIQALNG